MKRQDLEQLADSLGGLCILGCLPGSPADLAGLRYGDIVLQVNGHATPDMDSYIEAIRVRVVPMKVRIFRNGQEFDLELALSPEPRQIDANQLLEEVSQAGIFPKSFGPGAATKDDSELLS